MESLQPSKLVDGSSNLSKSVEKPGGNEMMGCCYCGAKFNGYCPIICPICANRKFAPGGYCSADNIIEIAHWRPQTHYLEKPRYHNF